MTQEHVNALVGWTRMSSFILYFRLNNLYHFFGNLNSPCPHLFFQTPLLVFHPEARSDILLEYSICRALPPLFVFALSLYPMIRLFYKALIRNVPKPFLRLLHTKTPSKPSLPIAVKENKPDSICPLPSYIMRHQGLALPDEAISVLHPSHQDSYSIFPSFTAFITKTFLLFIASNSSGVYTRISRATFGIKVE